MKKFVYLLLVFCLIFNLSACSSDDSYDYNSSTQDEIYNSESPDYSDIKKDSNTYKNVAPSVESCNDFINYIDSIETEYTYSSYYKIEEAFEKYENLPSFESVKHSNLLTNITEDSLFECVKKNNKAYMSKIGPNDMTLYEEFKDKDLKSYCAIVVKAVNHYLSENKIDDTKKVQCVLGNLKIFEDPTTMNHAYVSDENCLLIAPGMIEALGIKDTTSDTDTFLTTITHETMHLLQKGCDHTNKFAYHIGNSYKFEDMDIYPMFNNWFYEGSAEKLANNYTGYQPLVYEFYIYYIQSLTLSAVLDKNNSVYDVEQSTLSYSLDPLFEYFSCKTEEDKIEILNMLFSLEFIETDDEEFKNAVNPDMDENELVTIKRDMKNSVCETMSKIFYSALSKNLSENEMPLNDIFYYITVFEHDINSHISFTDNEKKTQAETFIKNYTEIQDRFFELLADNGEYTYEEITDMFNSYGLITVNDEDNFSLSDLPSDKQKLISEIFKRTYSYDFTNIRICK